jgi:putative DNA primase/helicase
MSCPNSEELGAVIEELANALQGAIGQVALLRQEWTGYLLTSDTSHHKFVVFEGEGANGKSVFLDVLTALLGEDNVAHVPLEMFGTRFQLTATLHKLANICAEVGEIDKVAEGYLKQFTAGDRMYFDRKNISPVNAYPTARLVLSTNNRPRFRDRSAGLWRRMILVPFRVMIPSDRQDPQLKEKLKQELPGILLWALEGLQRLRRNERFTEHAGPRGAALAHDHQDAANRLESEDVECLSHEGHSAVQLGQASEEKAHDRESLSAH